MKQLTKAALPSMLIAVFVGVLLFAPHTLAQAPIESGADAARGSNQTADLFGSKGVFRTITDVLLYVLGAISVIMIIIGGLRYVISGGNSTNVTAAKNTILYAIVGVIIAILSYAIIHFVLGSFTSGSGGGGGTNV